MKKIMKNIFKQKKRIEEDDLIEIKKRKELIEQYIMTSRILESEMRNFLNSKLSKYGLDGNKVWNFDVETGTIVDVTQSQATMQNNPMPSENIQDIEKPPVLKNKDA